MIAERSTVLYIEDDLDDQIIFRECINHVRPDIVCEFADDALKALEKLRNPSFHPTCIFIDVNMPMMNGNELLRAIKAMPSLAHIPCFMLSTSASRKDVENALANGAREYLVKPAVYIDFEKLLEDALQKVER